MFLNHLEAENKERFLKICVHAALANGIIADEEELILDSYCREMEMPVYVPDMEETFEALVQELQVSATKVEKTIIVLETLALVKLDGEYEEKEQAFMNNLKDALGLSDLNLSEASVLLDKYFEVEQELFDMVMQ